MFRLKVFPVSKLVTLDCSALWRNRCVMVDVLDLNYMFLLDFTFIKTGTCRALSF